MHVWHVGADANPESPSGASQTAWQLATALYSLGVSGAIVATGTESPHPKSDHIPLDASWFAGRRWTEPRFSDLMRRLGPPDLIQFHSVFQPGATRIAQLARRLSIPYVTRTAGGLLPEDLRQGQRVRKRAYLSLFEGPTVRGAAGIVAVSKREAAELRALTRGRTPIALIPNPVSPCPAASLTYETRGDHVLYLGRWDVPHKGIDRLVALATRMPETPFVLHVDRPWLGNRVPPNVSVLPALSGNSKWSALCRAGVVAHAARWEVFGRTIAEAMSTNAPIVLSNQCDWAERWAGLPGLRAIDFDDLEVAESAVRSGLTDESVRPPSKQVTSRDYVTREFSPQRVATRYAAMYRTLQVSRSSK